MFKCKKKSETPPPPATPNPLPTVTTSPTSNITDSTATTGGTVSSEGTSALTAVGVCWDTLPSPTTLKFKINNGAGTGSYVSNLAGLKVNKTYYVRAYATNGNGTAYGNEISFQTPKVTAWQKSTSATSFSITCMTSSGSSIYAGTANGVIFSSDTGNTWTQKGLGGLSIYKVYKKSSTVYAITSSGSLYSSVDNGANWIFLNSNFPYAVSIGAVVEHNTKLYVGTDSSAFVSSNQGSTWTRINNNLPKPMPGWWGGAVPLMTSNGTNLFAFGEEFVGPNSQHQLYRYDETNNTWILLNTLDQSTYLYALDYSGTNLFQLYSGNGTSFIDRSTDGQNWTTVTNGTSLGIYGQNVFMVGTAGTFSLSGNNGNTFSEVKKFGLPVGLNVYYTFITQNYIWIQASGYDTYRFRYN
jgi:photosystem II stability/assembly factor-like uncharacterized protein